MFNLLIINYFKLHTTWIQFYIKTCHAPIQSSISFIKIIFSHFVSVPAPVAVTNLCATVNWQPPANPNGVLIGYDIEVAGQVTRVSVNSFFYATTLAEREANFNSRVR